MTKWLLAEVSTCGKGSWRGWWFSFCRPQGGEGNFPFESQRYNGKELLAGSKNLQLPGGKAALATGICLKHGHRCEEKLRAGSG